MMKPDQTAPLVALPHRHVPRSYPAGSNLPERYTAADLAEWEVKIRAQAELIGINVPDIVFHLVQSEEMYDVAARGLPGRYSHWWFGQQYATQKTDYDMGRSRIYELVINTLPPHAYLLDGNSIVSQLMVMSHVYAHVGYFLESKYFSKTDRKILPRVAHAAGRIDGYMSQHGRHLVEDWVEHVEALAWQLPYEQLGQRRESQVQDSIDPFDDLFPEEVAAGRQALAEDRARRSGRFPQHPERDVLGFVMKHARRLTDWQRDLISIIRSETEYFVPQTRTQVMNEGYACVRGDMRIATPHGLLSAREFVQQQEKQVWDGDTFQSVTAWLSPGEKSGKIIKTKRGFTLAASDTHRVLLADGTWKYMDSIEIGDDLALPTGPKTWAQEYVTLDWEPAFKMRLEDIALTAGVSRTTVSRIINGGGNAKNRKTILPLLEAREQTYSTESYRKTISITVPKIVDEQLAAFLGYIIADGYISQSNRVIGMVSADYEQAERFKKLGESLFGIECRLRPEPGKWRAHFSSKELEHFLVHLGLPTGRSARKKRVPEVIFRSPESVVRSFLRAAYDADGCASKTSGVIYTTYSDGMAQDFTELLWNYGILSRRQKNGEGWNIMVMSEATKQFEECIGFGLQRKANILHSYINDRKWFCAERRDNIVTEIVDDTFPVYDIDVSNSHQYTVPGTINHNCLTHLHIMHQLHLPTEAFLEFQALTSGVVAPRLGHPNPYSLGLIMWQEIARMCVAPTDEERERWEWAGKVPNEWDKIHEIIEGYDDAAFIAEFLTPRVCERAKLFAWDAEQRSAKKAIVVSSHESEIIKERLVTQHTNRGLPIIAIVDADGLGRGELWLKHQHNGTGLDPEYAQHTLNHLAVLWGKRAVVETVDGKGKPRWFSATASGEPKSHSEKPD